MKKTVQKEPVQNAQSSHKADFEALCGAFLQLKTKDECERFLLDLCTPAEITAFAERWRVAQLLNEGNKSYQEIHNQTAVSITTIGRVARFLTQEPHHGYQLVLQRIKQGK